MGSGSPDERLEVLARIADEVRRCRACPLHEGTRNAVPGEGNPYAEVMLIGEAPGQHEDAQGRPFVGASGQFLTQLLAAAGYPRSEVFIANVAKHRPPANRDPMPDEIAACSDFLQRQVDAIDPLVIVTLGRHSMARYFPGERISHIHGQPRIVRGRVVLPLYHPAAALHQGALRKVLEADFSTLPSIVERARRRRDNAVEAPGAATPVTDDGPRNETGVPGTARVVREVGAVPGAPVQASFGLIGMTSPDPAPVMPKSEGTPRVTPPRQLPLL
jgi:DNA polymerase